jgi:hypothetical protein
MTDNYIRSTMLGAVIGMTSLATMYFLFYVIPKPATPEVSAPESNFEVVDSYKGCDVVRWSDRGVAAYRYFLHCPGN